MTRYLPARLLAILRRGRAFVLKPSAHSVEAAKVVAPIDYEAMIIRVYRLILRRTPAPPEVQAWTQAIVDRSLTEDGLVVAISSSPEARAVLANAAMSGSKGEIEAAVVRIYQLTLDRTPSNEDRGFWVQQVLEGRMNVPSVLETIATSPEAKLARARGEMALHVPNGKFIQLAYERLLGRGAMLDEVLFWDDKFSQGFLSREQMVTSLFARHAAETLEGEDQVTHDASSAHIMGTDDSIKIKDWQARAAALGPDVKPKAPKIYRSLALPRTSDVLVSAIASLYAGREFIEQFLDNITSQTIFSSCELIIVDADSPENEFEVIASYMERFPNIVYRRAASRIGIYEAWNVGVQMAKGRYLTNTNLDDLRRFDSFERQAEILAKFPFVDVAYQDFYYSFDGKASVAKTAAVNVHSELPVISPYNILRSNSPHNAPMWRRELHDDVGMFDPTYRSAGDHDFWLRCIKAGKVFYKVNDPHVVYFVNPEGLSTRPNTRGIEEGRRTTREHGREIISPLLLGFDDEFLAELNRVMEQPIALSDSERGSREWRYAAVQRALRSCSIASRGAQNLAD